MAGTGLARLSYVVPILATVFCCLIGGIVSIVYTAKANEAAASGDVVRYESARKARQGWLVATIILAIVACILQIALLAMEA